MANVLNRRTKAYLRSVNTPDYDTSDWMINPDLSQVEGIAQKYWVLEIATNVISEAYSEIDPDTLEQIDYPQVTEQVDIVRPMTQVEMDAYDAENIQVPIFSGKLLDGTPAYLYEGHAISVNSMAVRFFAKTSGSKNFNLLSDSETIELRNWNKPQLIKRVFVGCANNAEFTLSVRNENGDTLYEALVVGTHSADISVPIQSDTTLSCYVSGTQKVKNPEVIFQIAQRDPAAV